MGFLDGLRGIGGRRSGKREVDRTQAALTTDGTHDPQMLAALDAKNTLGSPMATLSFDGAPETKLTACNECNSEHERTTGFLLAGGNAYSVYWVDWYPHTDEAYVDLILGSWIEPLYEDHVTFGCRIGDIEGQIGPQCSLVHGGATRSDSQMFGTKLAREDALAHGRLAEFWRCIDWLTINDPILHEHIFHALD